MVLPAGIMTLHIYSRRLVREDLSSHAGVSDFQISWSIIITLHITCTIVEVVICVICVVIVTVPTFVIESSWIALTIIRSLTINLQPSTNNIISISFSQCQEVLTIGKRVFKIINHICIAFWKYLTEFQPTILGSSLSFHQRAGCIKLNMHSRRFQILVKLR